MSPLVIFSLLAMMSFSTPRATVALATQDEPEATQVVFTNPSPILCADRASNNAGTNPGLPPLYPSNINVAGLTGTITKVTVSFAITSTFPDDLDILLIGPTGARSLVLSDAGFTADLVNVSYTFDQAAATAFPDQPATAVPTGTYRPANYLGLAAPEPGGADNFPTPGPGLLSYPTDFNIFNGTNPNGVWSLYVVDDQVLDVNNSLPSGWSINITVAAPPTTPNSRVCDFDGDNKTDLATVRTTAGQLTWMINNSMTGTPTNQPWGLSTDVLIPQDYDGDGKTDIAVWRPGSPATWYFIRSSNSTFRAINFGQTGDNPSVADDYDGDGKADLAVTRNIGGAKFWFVLNSIFSPPTDGAGNGQVTVRQWGLAADFVSPGDYDGDGKADYGVQRAEGVAPDKATFYISLSGGGAIARPWGRNTHLIVPGDYDGDNKVDIAVLEDRAGSIYWWVVLSNGGFVLGDLWGQTGDIPVQGDYDGDSKTDQAVWRPSTATFMIKQSSGGVVSIPFGANGDTPPAFYNTH
jgi:hypothetical protein